MHKNVTIGANDDLRDEIYTAGVWTVWRAPGYPEWKGQNG